MRLLRMDSSARGNSVTRKLTGKFTDIWKQEHPDGLVVERDLSTVVWPPITDEWSATYSDPAKLTPEQRAYLSVSDALIAEMAADVIVIGAPMYNFTISWPLKAWIDQVVRIGKTVAYSATGPKGLLEGKQVVVVTARGGSYVMDPAAPRFDLQETYLRRILGFIGLTDVEFIHAENQLRPEQGAASLAAAMTRVEESAAELSAATRALIRRSQTAKHSLNQKETKTWHSYRRSIRRRRKERPQIFSRTWNSASVACRTCSS